MLLPGLRALEVADGLLTKLARKMISMKQISAVAYQALRDALPVVTWYKDRFATLVRTALSDYPDLLVGLDFVNSSKREVADALVQRLVDGKEKYRDITIRLMLEVAKISSFPDIERLQEPDRTLRLKDARLAVASLKEQTEEYSEELRAKAEIRARREEKKAQRIALRKFSDELDGLKQRYLLLTTSDNPQRRGLDFEVLLRDLFNLFDMEPRTSYSTETEQIDGSLSFNTDDYLLEAKWIADPVSREFLDAFAAKVRRKGKNALGIFIAVNGFSRPALNSYKESTSFICFDGQDLYLVLDERIRLDEMLRAKLRHANDTGSCFLPAASLVSSS